VIQICGRLVWPTSNKNALSMSNRNSIYKKGTKCAAVAGKRFHQNQLRGASSVYRHKTSTPRHTQKAISKKSSGDLLTNRHWGFIRAWISGILVVLICFDCCKRHWLQKMSSLVQHKRIQTLEIISFLATEWPRSPGWSVPSLEPPATGVSKPSCQIVKCLISVQDCTSTKTGTTCESQGFWHEGNESWWRIKLVAISGSYEREG